MSCVEDGNIGSRKVGSGQFIGLLLFVNAFAGKLSFNKDCMEV